MSIELSKYEVLALKLRDLYNLEEEICATQMNLGTKEFKILILETRKKVYNAIINGDLIIVEEDIVEIIEPKSKSICKFRCGVCGVIYEIDYKKDDIKCPLCYSSKVMKYK